MANTLKGTSNFRRGLTTLKRVDPNSSDSNTRTIDGLPTSSGAVMKTIDGFFTDDGTLAPQPGSAKKSANGLYTGTTYRPLIFRMADGTRSMIAGCGGPPSIQQEPFTLDMTESTNDWVGAGVSTHDALDIALIDNSRFAKCREQVLIPTEAGIMRLEPLAVKGGEQTTAYLLGMKSPYDDYADNSGPTVTLTRQGTVVDNCETAWTGLVTPGVGGQFTLTLSTDGKGTIVAATVGSSGGLGYGVGNVFDVIGGNNDAQLQVTGVAAGAITTLAVVNGGSGYTNATPTSIELVTSVNCTLNTQHVRQGSNSAGISLVNYSPSSYAAGRTLASTVDISSADYIVAWIWLDNLTSLSCNQGVQGIIWPAAFSSAGLGLHFYDNAGTPKECGWAEIPVLQQGWNCCVMRFQYPGETGDRTNLKSIYLVAEEDWAHAFDTVNIMLDDIRAVTAAQLGAWNGIGTVDITMPTVAPQGITFPGYNQQYVYAYGTQIAKESGETLNWTIGNPSIITDLTQGVLSPDIPLGPGDLVEVVCNGHTASADCGATDIFVYRRSYQILNNGQVGGAQFAEVGKVAWASSATLTDTGALSTDYDETVGRPQYAEFDHDMPSLAKYLLVADGRVYGLNLGSRPCGIEVSTYEYNSYFPTTVDSTSPEGNGEDLGENFATTANEGRGWGKLGSQKIVFYDNEFGIVQGTNWGQGWQYVRVAQIGLVDWNCEADCETCVVWLASQGFQRYSGGMPVDISIDRVDHTDIDLSKYHEAVYLNHKYIFFAYKISDGNPYLWMYDVMRDGWVIRSAQPLIGLAADQDTNFGELWGIEGLGGYAVQLMAPNTWTDFNGASGVSGTGNLVPGFVNARLVITNSAVTSNSVVTVAYTSGSGPGNLSVSVTPGVGFTILSSDEADSNSVTWTWATEYDPITFNAMTQNWMLTPPIQDLGQNVVDLDIDSFDDTNSVTVDLVITSLAADDSAAPVSTSKTITVNPGSARYRVPVDIRGYAIAVQATYTTPYPPTIQSIFVEAPGASSK
jgi:hypothetical protein